MADERIDTDYKGRPVDPLEFTDADRAELDDVDLREICDATAHQLPDGRWYWSCVDGTFLDKDGRPDRTQPIDDPDPAPLSIGEAIRNLDRAAGR